jgi:biotin transport system substrate-specific component
VSVPNDLLWAFIGLLLTIFSTFVEASIALPSAAGVSSQKLGVTYQIGAVLLTGCLGGRNAGIISQTAYLFLGLTWLPVFAGGGGISYLSEPSFGYLLGFVPGAALCGWWAFRSRARLEILATGAFLGLLTIHLVGIIYIVGLSLVNPRGSQLFFPESIGPALVQYSLLPLPGQIIVTCAATLLALLVRKLLFY